ncbi:hypothetical protein [Domibacillus epiphyticus]|uniref:Uncharacterized protein n=1 Tax=Domibacillus epiphyticus TaxID=1714355 RepID=A0A1V2A7A1_9BACI|nr:hypothetical protein [Domibacillus epiphyticus]OMP66881.1 hypothetical protein BTO28_09720 [Domibacillus epiphyticus]
MKNIKQFLNYNDRESKIFMPNEIFTDIRDERIKKGHRPFTFSYYYLINYLYRNAKYGDMKTNITTKDMVDVLGFSPENRRLSYIMKDNGVLDQMKYTETTRDIPVLAGNFKDMYGHQEGLDFEYYEYYPDMADYVKGFANSYKIKKPVLAFNRHIKDPEWIETYQEEDYRDGTFYEVENTTLIPFEVFLFCMEHKDIECDGFYLYSYLKMMNDRFPNGYRVALTQLCNDLGFSRGNLVNTLDALKRHRMIQVIHNQSFFAVGLKEEDRMPNSYIINDWEYFNDNGDTEYEKIKYIDRKKYEEILEKEKKEQEEKNKKKKAYVALEDLPY